MANYQFLLDAFGLQLLRPGQGPRLSAGVEREYTQGADLPTGIDRDYEEVEIIEPSTLTVGSDGGETISALGTPVFADLILEDADGSGLYLDTILITVSNTKRIASTVVQGRDGTIKEYNSDGDYEVNIKGMLVSPAQDAYPRDSFAELIRLCKEKSNLKCISPYLQLFGVYELTVMSRSFPQQQGFQNVQLFEVDCLSDIPVELIEGF